MESQKGNGEIQESRISLVDVLVILIKRRRLWISITLLGTALIAAGLGSQVLIGNLRAKATSSYTTTVKALMTDASVADLVVSFATSKPLADFIAKEAGDQVAQDFFAGASASYDQKNHYLLLSVKAPDEKRSRAAATAAIQVFPKATANAFSDRSRAMGDRMQNIASSLSGAKPSANPSDSLRAAAVARVNRIERELFLDTLGPRQVQNDPMYLIIAEEAKMQMNNEWNAVNYYFNSNGGNQAVLAPILDAEIARLLRERASQYLSSSGWGIPITLVDTVTANSYQPGRFEAKTVGLAFFAFLIIGILVAALTEILGELFKKPETRDRLREAWNWKPPRGRE